MKVRLCAIFWMPAHRRTLEDELLSVKVLCHCQAVTWPSVAR